MLDFKTDEFVVYPAHGVGKILAVETQKVADIELETLQINLKTIDKNILKKAKFIIPVHLFGGLVDVKHLLHISKEYKLKIIEDVAQSFGTKFKNKFFA